MIKKRILYLAIISILGCTSLSAIDVMEKDNNSNTSNEIDDSYSERKGWSFYFDEKISDENKKKASKEIKKAELDLLQKIDLIVNMGAYFSTFSYNSLNNNRLNLTSYFC